MIFGSVTRKPKIGTVRIGNALSGIAIASLPGYARNPTGPRVFMWYNKPTQLASEHVVP